VLAERGTAALIVRGHDGLDEITTAGPTGVWTASGDGIRKVTFDTARFGLRRARPGDLAGGDAPYNAKVVRAVAAGEPGPALDAVLANAAGALAARNSATSAGDFDDTFSAGLDEARAAVGSGCSCQASRPVDRPHQGPRRPSLTSLVPLPRLPCPSRPPARATAAGRDRRQVRC